MGAEWGHRRSSGLWLACALAAISGACGLGVTRFLSLPTPDSGAPELPPVADGGDVDHAIASDGAEHEETSPPGGWDAADTGGVDDLADAGDDDDASSGDGSDGNRGALDPASSLIHVQDCLLASRHFGIQPGVSMGFAPPYVQSWWLDTGCDIDGTFDTCQQTTVDYGIDAWTTFGYAPDDVRAWWYLHGCTAMTSVGECQAASDRFGIVGTETVGIAPPYVQRWWTTQACLTAPSTDISLCQRAANFYRICAGKTFGYAPNEADDTTIDIQGWWTANGCTACADRTTW